MGIVKADRSILTCAALAAACFGPALPAWTGESRAPGVMIEHPTAKDCEWVEAQIPVAVKRYGNPDSGNVTLVRTNAELCRQDLVVESLVKSIAGKVAPYTGRGLGELFAASHEAWRRQRIATCGWSRAGNTGAFNWNHVEELACMRDFGKRWEVRLKAFDSCVSAFEPSATPDDYWAPAADGIAGCSNHLDLLPADFVER